MFSASFAEAASIVNSEINYIDGSILSNLGPVSERI